MNVKEGRRIKSGNPMDAVARYIMPSRAGASNLFKATADITKCEQFIREQRAGKMKNLGMMHIFLAAYTRVVSQYPGINRFVRGQRLYARNNIEICLTIKKEMKLNADETVVQLSGTPYDTLFTIYDKLHTAVSENKQDGDQNSMDAVARLLTYIPGIFLKFTIWILKILDYFGLLPRFIRDASPFHGSMFITNMGSLGIAPIYHHLYDFGNLPIFIAMGSKRTEYVVNKDGETAKKRVIDFTVTCDERICDGHYYATAFKKLKKLLENPEELLIPPTTVVEDIK